MHIKKENGKIIHTFALLKYAIILIIVLCLMSCDITEPIKKTGAKYIVYVDCGFACGNRYYAKEVIIEGNQVMVTDIEDNFFIVHLEKTIISKLDFNKKIMMY